jgi:hypothetical protein
MHARKVRHGIAAIVAIAVAVTFIPAATASAEDYGSLTATWWQWVYTQPAKDVGTTNTFPILDSTGTFGAVDQRRGIGPDDNYFFLTGTFGATVTRRVTVPRDKTLFFPIINIETDNASDPPTDYDVAQLRANAAATIDAAANMSASFDGNPVDFFRVTSPVFDYQLPDKNSIYEYLGLTGPQFEGVVSPAVSDGFWAFVPPPSTGKHTLHFHSEIPSFSFVVDVTYDLTVA